MQIEVRRSKSKFWKSAKFPYSICLLHFASNRFREREKMKITGKILSWLVVNEDLFQDKNREMLTLISAAEIKTTEISPQISRSTRQWIGARAKKKWKKRTNETKERKKWIHLKRKRFFFGRIECLHLQFALKRSKRRKTTNHISHFLPLHFEYFSFHFLCRRNIWFLFEFKQEIL